MKISPELLAAYADGELDGSAASDVEAELERDPALRTQLEAHHALKARLVAVFAPVAELPVPARLREALQGEVLADNVVDFAGAVGKRRKLAPNPWFRFGGPALAASLVLAIIGLGHSRSGQYAGNALGQALDNQLVATQSASGSVRILLSFRDGDGRYCRGFSAESRAGIACRDAKGWRLRNEVDSKEAGTTEFRQAGSSDAEVMDAIQDIANGAALDDSGERAARQQQWQARR
ncbi:MAG TPA: hypothetical protein VHG29_04315 [Novosphingobium sp.]|nr:hypothetical protein [Novosphingobium sp.]